MNLTTAEALGDWFGRLDAGRVAGWVTLILVVVLAFSLARLTWFVISPAPVSFAAAPVEQTPMSIDDRDGPMSRPVLDSVAELSLFGRAVPQEQVALAELDAPETRLRLQLRGVVAATPAGQGVALISSESDAERHYLPGDELPGGATLAQVHGDRVILRREGRYEMLRLPREASLSDAVSSPPAQPLPVANGGGGVTETQRQQWIEDPTTLFDAVQVQPVMQDGNIRGFAISPRRDVRLFREVGLRPGDVVTSINEIDVAGMTDPTAIRDQLSGASELRLNIERDGQPDTIVIPVGP